MFRRKTESASPGDIQPSRHTIAQRHTRIVFYYAFRSARDVIKKHSRQRLRIAFRADFSRTFLCKLDGGALNSLCACIILCTELVRVWVEGAVGAHPVIRMLYRIFAGKTLAHDIFWWQTHAHLSPVPRIPRSSVFVNYAYRARVSIIPPQRLKMRSVSGDVAATTIYYYNIIIRTPTQTHTCASDDAHIKYT